MGMDRETLQQLLNSPIMEQFLNSNSESLRSMLGGDVLNHPLMQQAMQANPELRHTMEAMLRDPEMLRRSFEMMRNPDLQRVRRRGPEIGGKWPVE